MATGKYEFQCPQFVDFCSGVEGISRDDGHFGSAFPDKRSEWLLKSKYPIRKPNPRIRILSSTPVNKPSFINMSSRSNTTDSQKINRTKKVFKRLSKSMDSLHHLPEEMEQEFFPVVSRKRSISMTADKPKKLTHPITPKCLKRSLHSSKNKIFKTTEELELEKITLLQKQMSNHLRANEVAMRRLKIKQTYNMEKGFGKETRENRKNAENLPSRVDSFLERIKNVCSLPSKKTANGQCTINSDLKRTNHLNTIFCHDGRSNLAGPSNAHLTCVKKENGAFPKSTGIFHSRTNKNAENIHSMKSFRPPLKSRRCLFQENR